MIVFGFVDVVKLLQHFIQGGYPIFLQLPCHLPQRSDIPLNGGTASLAYAIDSYTHRRCNVRHCAATPEHSLANLTLRQQGDDDVLLTDLPRDLLLLCMPHTYGLAIAAIASTCRLLRDLCKQAAREYSFTCDPNERWYRGGCSRCCGRGEHEPHRAADCRLSRKLTTATQLPTLTSLRVNTPPGASDRDTIMLLSRPTTLTRLQLSSQRHDTQRLQELLDSMAHQVLCTEADTCYATAEPLAAALAGLSRVRSLKLQGNSLRTMEFLRTMTELSHLEFHGNSNTGKDLAILSQLPALRYLSLTALAIHDEPGSYLKCLAGLALQTLLLLCCPYGDCVYCLSWRGPGAEDVQALASLTGLQHLKMQAGCVTGAVSLVPLCALTRLTRLHVDSFNRYLSNYEPFSAANCAALAALPTVRHLSLDATNLAPGSLHQLAPMTQLESLQLRMEPARPSDAPEALDTLTALTSLGLAGHHIGAGWAPSGPHGVRTLALNPARAATLVQLDVSDAAICDQSTWALASVLTSLRNLNLSKNRLTYTGHLARLRALIKLDLGSTRLGCDVIEGLTVLTALRRLHLRSTGCGDRGLLALTALTDLSRLELRKNAFKNASCLRALTALNSLRHLDLRSNKLLEDGCREALETLTQLTFVALANNGIGQEAKVLAATAAARGVMTDL